MEFIAQTLIGSFLCLVFIGIVVGIGYVADLLSPWERLYKEAQERFWWTDDHDHYDEY